MGMADALKQAAAVNAAPGFGAGSALYRPPEMDYLAGLVSLAETRGAAVAEATEEGQEKEKEEMEVDGAEEDGEQGEGTSKKKNKNKKKRKNKINKAIKKGMLLTPFALFKQKSLIMHSNCTLRFVFVRLAGILLPILIFAKVNMHELLTLWFIFEPVM